MTRADRRESPAHRIAQLRRAARPQRERLLKAAVLLVDGGIDREAYELLRDAARAELDAIERELDSLGAQQTPTVPDLDTVLAEAGGWRATIYSSDISEQRAVLAGLIERVVPRRVAHGDYDVQVSWTRTGEMVRETVGAMARAAAAPEAA